MLILRLVLKAIYQRKIMNKVKVMESGGLRVEGDLECGKTGQ